LLNPTCIVLANRLDRSGQVHGREQLVQRRVGFGEVLTPDRSPVVRQPFGEAQERTLRRTRCLIAELAIADLRHVNTACDLLRNDVRVELLERQSSLGHRSLPPAFRAGFMPPWRSPRDKDPRQPTPGARTSPLAGP